MAGYGHAAGPLQINVSILRAEPDKLLGPPIGFRLMAPDADLLGSSSTSDFGLLILRVATGAALVQAGLVKLLDFNTVVGFMESGGWKVPLAAAVMVTAAEAIGGLAMMLGLLTPLAACAATAAMIDAWAATVSGSAFWSQPFNVPFMIGFASMALLLTGAGRFSLDEYFWGRAWWPRLVSVILLVVAIAAAVATWVFLNGVNPLHFTAPAA